MFSYSELNVVPVAKTSKQCPADLLADAAVNFGNVASSPRIRRVMRKRNTQEISLDFIRAADLEEDDEEDVCEHAQHDQHAHACG